MKIHTSVKAATCLDMIEAFKNRIVELDPSAAMNNIQSANLTNKDYISGVSGSVDEAYIDDMMSYVADDLTDSNSTCTWMVQGDAVSITVTNLDLDAIDEYSCPIADLIGDIDADKNYILDAIRQ